MFKGSFGSMVLMLYCVYNHPTLVETKLLQYIYYVFMILIALLESFSLIPDKNHLKYFRRVKGETCILGMMILPLLGCSYSVMWQINYLAFSLLSLSIYLSLKYQSKYSNALYVSYLSIILLLFPIYSQYLMINKLFTYKLFIYHLMSLIIYDVIFNKIIKYFNSTFTFSDTIIVSSMLFFIAEQSCVITIACFMPQIAYFQSRLIIHEYHIISFIMISFSLLISIIIFPFITKKYPKNKNAHILIFIILIIVLIIWLNFVLNRRCNIHPSHCKFGTLLAAVINVLIDSNHGLILLYWISLLLFCFFITPIPKYKNIVIIRKYFHGWCLILFLPIIKYDSIYLSLSFSIALFWFIIFESIRINNYFCCGYTIENYCRPFLDERDGGKLVLTHFWLLIGCCIPLWYSFIDNNKNNNNQIYAVSGIIILGIGDALAAIIGSNFGKIKWMYTNKTIEGTLAGIISSLLLYCIMFQINDKYLIWNLLKVITVTFILEAITKQIDNLYLPLFCCLLMDVTFS